MFTQEQVARLLRSERSKATARYADYEQIKGRLEELEAAGQSELERLQAKIQEADERARMAEARANRYIVRSELISAAARHGAVDPEIVVAMLAEGLEVNADGEVEGDVGALIVKLLDERPYLRAQTNGKVGSADAGAHSSGGGSAKSPNQRMDDALRGAN
jgi:hypothetical protein